MNGELQKEFEYYLNHRDELIKQFEGKVVIIKDQKVRGAYDNELSAIADAKKQELKLGSFLVQRVAKDAESYQQTFHSRVAFG